MTIFTSVSWVLNLELQSARWCLEKLSEDSLNLECFSVGWASAVVRMYRDVQKKAFTMYTMFEQIKLTN